MIDEDQTDPLEIRREPQVVKDAQAELSKIDVLVCGECHEVFHFIEEFQNHRSQNKCTKESDLKNSCQNESKSQLWAFMLWKSAKFKSSSDEETPPSSWNVYQLWCNLAQSQKDAWINAGKELQNIHLISSSKLQIIAKPVNKQVKEETVPKVQKRIKANDSCKLEQEQDPLAGTESDMDTDIEDVLEKHKICDEKSENGGIKKTILKPVQLNSDKGLKKRAIRTNKDDKKTEYIVEKIISKRYNPGKKTHEYLIKWESFEENQNTWEPVSHLEKCKALLEEFDKNLQKAKLQKVPKTPVAHRKVYKKEVPDKNEDVILTSGGRPQRTSKQKALNQVKVWCGNISDDGEEDSRKRAYSDSDSDSFEKRIKLEAESSDSEDEKPPVTVKRILKTPLNGVGKKHPLPENILVPDAQGVVRINQKQLPALSSGVYVMSKTAGIIKLDSNTSKIAASGGHAVIKVAPKIGQTSIKVIRKEPTNGSKPNIVTPKAKQSIRPIGAKLIPQRKSNVTSVIKKPEPAEMKVDDDDSDGLEEMPFPTDLPLPQPDSPPGNYTLCPLTGKILGQDDMDDCSRCESNKDLIQDLNTSDENTTNLDNLVNLAAADILNESLHTKDKSENKDMDMTNDKKDSVGVKVDIITNVTVDNSSVNIKSDRAAESKCKLEDTKSNENEEVNSTQSIEEALSAMEADTPAVRTSIASNTSSILSTALSIANIEPTVSPNVQKKIVNTPEAIRQRTAMNRNIINRTIVPKPAPQAIITRITPGSANKNRQMINKQKLGVPPPTSFRKAAVRQTYSNKNSSIIRKIGNTSVYQSASTTNIKELKPSVVRTTTTESLVQTLTGTSTTAVINMPLLSEAETTANSINVTNVDIETESTSSVAVNENIGTELNTMSLNDTETPLLITGEDGTIYQVAGQNEDGQTILIAQDADGQQQCLLVASESASDLTETAVINTPVTSEVPEQIEEPLVTSTELESDSAEDSQIVAQIVSAQPPSPGGTRKVVLMLPDGNLMMTEVTAEQYAALELDK